MIVHEFVNGKFQFKAADELSEVPFSLDASYIGYGEFVVKRDYRLRYIGQVAFTEAGQCPIKVKKLHALVYAQ